MCTGLELLFGALAAGGAAASTLLAPEASVPEVPDTPAMDADAARDSGATVRVGVRNEDDGEILEEDTTEFVEQRKQAKTITGLGRGGLAL